MKKTWIILFCIVFVAALVSTSGNVEAKKASSGTNAELYYVAWEIKNVQGIYRSDSRSISIRTYYIDGKPYCALPDLAYELKDTPNLFDVVWNPMKKRTELHLGEYYKKEQTKWKEDKVTIFVNWASADLWIGEKSERFTGFVYQNRFFVSLDQISKYIGFEYKFEKETRFSWIKERNERLVTISITTKIPSITLTTSKIWIPSESKLSSVSDYAEVKEDYIYEEEDKNIYLKIKATTETFGSSAFIFRKHVYSKDWKLLKSEKISFPALGDYDFGGFLAGKKYNYFVFGRNNSKRDDTVNVLTVIKTDKEFKEIGRTEINNCSIAIPFVIPNLIPSFGDTDTSGFSDFAWVRSGGMASMAEHEDTLVFHTQIIDYSKSKRLFSVTIDTPTMKILSKSFWINQIDEGDSFNVFTLFDENGEIFFCNNIHMYSHPLSIYKADAKNLKVSNHVEILDIPYVRSYDTGLFIGDALEMKKNIVVGVNQIDYSKVSASKDKNNFEGKDLDKRDVYLYFVDKKTFRVKSKRLTDYTLEKEREASYSAPYLVKLNENKMLALWMKKLFVVQSTIDNPRGKRARQILQYQLLDAEGNALSDVKEKPWLMLGDARPVYDNGKLVWINGDIEPASLGGQHHIMYSLDITDLE